MKQEITIFWFRRDLRLDDNHGLYQALKANMPVLPLFIFDTNILDKLEDKADRRVDFIHKSLIKIQERLQKHGSDLLIKYGDPLKIWNGLFEEYSVKKIVFNHDYEQYAIARDNKIASLAKVNNCDVFTFKDHVVFEKTEILSGSNTPYTVFSPYSRKWKEVLAIHPPTSFETNPFFESFLKFKSPSTITLTDMGFKETDISAEIPTIENDLVINYAQTRDFPALLGTSRLSIHLRFGTVSIREYVEFAQSRSEVWLNELIWRDFYFNILANFPQVTEGKAFKSQYDNIRWRNNEKEFELWCQGNTGFPIVDAGMRELNNTGFMHNRVRMIVASFLCKDLLVDWRWGEAYFAQKLNDFDFSANNGGWQWASGSGCDAAPYFRVFNPDSQTLKFDKNLEYIKKWVPELNDFSYKPMLDHKMARERALKTYGEGLKT